MLYKGQIIHRKYIPFIVQMISRMDSKILNKFCPLQESAGEEVIMLLLGNKSDCAGREVTPSEGKLLAKVQYRNSHL
jgi:hypothetical protein